MNSLDKKKPKELDWHIKWDYLLNKKKWKNPDEVNKVLTKFVEDLLTQQRTELLEEILNLECLKEEVIDRHHTSDNEMVIKFQWESNERVRTRNQLRNEIKKEIEKL